MSQLDQDIVVNAPESRTEEALRIMAIIDDQFRTRKKVLFNVPQMEFLNDTRTRLKQYKAKTRISQKQLFYLRDLKDRTL